VGVGGGSGCCGPPCGGAWQGRGGVVARPVLVSVCRELCCWRGVRQSGQVPRGGAESWLAWVGAYVRPVLAWRRCDDAEICLRDCCRCQCGVY
jgi:hypothetical protein